ncbi:hypothetical protein LUZ61_008154 [Rhynchospora tenuis]|uniref:NB-ARC domain-containing protein n=1 Tax=Rhynchospora tenuis TaxID=198213 RepID=A0AAD5ZUU4_9POAL|nr:hypothetical protein LUZ61_008154 [Rhynchospora tenuis]
MEAVLVSRLVTLLQQPGLMPHDMEEERQKLLNLLTAIKPMLGHAHFRVNQVRIPGAHDEGDAELRYEGDTEVRAWLSNLKEVAYHAHDIIDSLRYVKLQAAAEAESGCRQNGKKVSTFVLSSKISSIKLLFSKRRIRNIIDSVVERIGDLVEEMRALNFRNCHGITTDTARHQNLIFSCPTEIVPIVVGREKEKENIVRFLLDSPNTVRETIVGVLIEGFVGIGKRTLARYVCNDARINNHFECILWVDVVSEFTIGKIALSIINQAIGKDCCISENETYLLKRRINQELSGKRYLLVYNDVGGDEQLLVELKSWLEQGHESGNSLIVLTNWHNEAHNLCFTSPYVCELPELTTAELWELFCKNAFSDSNETCPEIFEDMGKQIVLRCGGSPLLVNLMGGLMRFKKELSEWQEVINQLENLNDRNTVSIAMLCYNYMSSETKQCFLFCSLFPSGYYMDKELLIKLWMANGLFSSDESTSLEEKGNNVFNELALRHFFEDVKIVYGDGDLYMNKQEYYSRVVCKIPPGINFLCISLAIDENIYRSDGRDKHFRPQTSQVRYLSIGGEAQIDFNMILKSCPLVRTLMSTGDPFVRTVKCSAPPKSNSLRALHLCSSLFEGGLLEVVQHMKHLRYLDLSSSRIKILPESICLLHNLQTLNVSKCLLLYQLPENMRYMRSLRHLYVHKCPKLKRMPPHLGKLIHLQTLSAYIVGEHAGNGIDEIRDLNLGDLLELYNLCNVRNAAEAKVVNLGSKTNLEILTLSWGSSQLVMSNRSNDLELLVALEPPKGLKVLKVQQYGDPKFATWLSNPVGLQNLVELHLVGCSQCKTLPAVWMLSSLQVLCLKHMISLTCICSIPHVDNDDSSKLFPRLKKLVLVDLKRLERWQEEETSLQMTLEFPLLSEIEITKCPILKTMPHVPNLRIMRLDSTDMFFMSRELTHSLLDFWGSLISLENLDICNCKSLVDWPLEEFRNLKKLKRLSFWMCPNLNGLFSRQLLEGEEHLPRLLTLEFYRCVSLKKVPKCSSVLNLEVDECAEVESISGIINLEMLQLSCTSWISLPAGLGDLKKLESLQLSECYSLTCLPDELAGITSLQNLIINKCPRVKSLPNGLKQVLFGLENFQTLDCPDLEKYCIKGPYSSIISLISTQRNDSSFSSTNFKVAESWFSADDAFPVSEDEEEDAKSMVYEDLPSN